MKIVQYIFHIPYRSCGILISITDEHKIYRKSLSEVTLEQRQLRETRHSRSILLASASTRRMDCVTFARTNSEHIRLVHRRRQCVKSHKFPNARGQLMSAHATFSEQTILVADIGGTNARFCIWHADQKRAAHTWTSETSKHVSFDSCLQQLMSELQINSFDAACFAVAGVVANNSCTLTNIGWTVDADSVKSKYNIGKVKVINDFEAVGYGVFELDQSDILTLNDGDRKANGSIAILGPGTGLGEAFLTWDDNLNRYEVHPTEGSHADFAARGEIQHALSLWVEKQLEECEVEHVCSGPGLVRIYDFLRSQNSHSSPVLTPAEISMKANSGGCDLCTQAVDIFLEILGAEAANLGLKCLATGGIYIAGGIPAKMKDSLSNGCLLKSFLRPGSKFCKLRGAFPLYVVLNPEVGILGSKAVALELL